MIDDWYRHGRNWSPEDVVRLCSAFRGGSCKGALAAFPDRSEAAVRAALRRYIDAPFGKPTPIDLAAVRERLNAMPIDTFAEGFELLSNRTANFMGAR